MKEMKVHESKTPVPVWCAVSGDRAPDMAIYAKSLDIDTLKDLAWFDAHPSTQAMIRKPTELELLAFNFQSDIRVVVRLDAEGKCWRYAVRPHNQKSDYLPG